MLVAVVYGFFGDRSLVCEGQHKNETLGAGYSDLHIVFLFPIRHSAALLQNPLFDPTFPLGGRQLEQAKNWPVPPPLPWNFQFGQIRLLLSLLKIGDANPFIQW
jgi:hypothetical protein